MRAYFKIIVILLFSFQALFCFAEQVFKWDDYLNQTIELKGKAINVKLGARLYTENGSVYIDKLSSWPKDLHNKFLLVKGTLIMRKDLPVFIREEGEPMIAGIEVPTGTDLEEASKRYLLSGATWQLVEKD